ncbi:hypothetical protein BH23CHL7_BH23CHL7_02550 [soil metagenome]
MYAVIETSGRQYRVELGSEIELDQRDAEPGSTIELGRVLLVADGDDAHVGQPVVDGASVTGEVLRHDRGDKIVVFKYRPKARTRVKHGHRADLTIVRVSDIVLNGRSAANEAKAAAKKEAAAREAAEKEAARKAAADQALAAKLAAEQEAEAKAQATADGEASKAKGSTARKSAGRAKTRAKATGAAEKADADVTADTETAAATTETAEEAAKPARAKGSSATSDEQTDTSPTKKKDE